MSVSMSHEIADIENGESKLGADSFEIAPANPACTKAFHAAGARLAPESNGRESAAVGSGSAGEAQLLVRHPAWIPVAAAASAQC